MLIDYNRTKNSIKCNNRLSDWKFIRIAIANFEKSNTLPLRNRDCFLTALFAKELAN